MKIFLASVESSECAALVKKGLIENGFFSYYYLRKRKVPQILIDSREKIKLIVVDSGAHTFFSEMQNSGLSVSVHTKKTKTKETPDEYFEEYISWVKKNWLYFDYFVELDIGEVVGQEKVLEWRERLKKESLYGKCITVYHPRVMSYDDWIATLEDSESKYVAVEGDRPRRPRLPYNLLIKPAYERGIKVHGFAFVKQEGLEKYPFFSVDASSWKSGVQYGSGIVPIKIKGGRTSTVTFKKKTSNVFSLSKTVANLENIYHNNKRVQREKRLEIAIAGYKQMQDHFTNLWTKRGIVWKT